ncbi:MAG: LexA family transcriptional regulator [Arcobacter sp.]|uniref:S24 family peptidase n=1 Tax=Arcobacter sp. TaxID=1872629 RepID=UPI003C730356
MEFGKKVKLARQIKKMSQDTLADLIGVNRVAISNIETGKNNPTHQNMLKIAEILDIDLSNDDNTSSVKFVPITGTASCGALEPSIYDHKDKAYYNGDFWKKSLYCVIACGDSMSPEIDDGDEVIIDPDVKPTTGDMVYYKVDDEAAIKVLVEDTDAYLLQFIPYNSSQEFKTKTIRIDDEETMSKLSIHKVVSVNKLKFNNRSARLKMIGRG